MDVDWFNTGEEQPEQMRNLAKELRLALFPQVSARKFRNWSTEAQREVDSCLLLALSDGFEMSALRSLSGQTGRKRNREATRLTLAV